MNSSGFGNSTTLSQVKQPHSSLAVGCHYVQAFRCLSFMERPPLCFLMLPDSVSFIPWHTSWTCRRASPFPFISSPTLASSLLTVFLIWAFPVCAYWFYSHDDDDAEERKPFFRTDQWTRNPLGLRRQLRGLKIWFIKLDSRWLIATVTKWVSSSSWKKCSKM